MCAQCPAACLPASRADRPSLPLCHVLPCSEAWAKFVHAPAVERLVAASRGQVEAAYSRYRAAHDALVVRGTVLCLPRSVSCCGSGSAPPSWPPTPHGRVRRAMARALVVCTSPLFVWMHGPAL